MDSSLPTYLLGYWVREKQAITLEDAVQQLSFVPASHWKMTGRGLLREGYAADIVVFDPDRIGPMMPELVHDLPAGARRLKQQRRVWRRPSSMAKCCRAITSIPAPCRVSSFAGR